MKTFLTADLHFDHQNIIKYCNRPFDNVFRMEEALIEGWNSVVRPQDIVYNLGDLSMKSAKHLEWYQNILRKLNGRHVLVLGNHDYLKPFQYLECGIESVHTSLIIDNIFLAHDPALATAIPKDMRMFCGHVHDTFRKLNYTKNVLNVGVDIWNYKPIEWDQAIEWLKHGPVDEYRMEDLEEFGRHNAHSDNERSP